MVKAWFDNKDGTLEMRVQGHAGFAEIGKDPVCAGASVLAMAAAQCIDWMGGHDCMEEPPKIHVAGGNVRVTCRPKEDYFPQVFTVMEVAQVGMLLLEGAYPEHAAVKTFAAAEAEAIKDSSTSRTD